VKVTFDAATAGLSSGTYPMVVTFPGMTTRVANATNSYTVP
jgi:hypothetical protein